MYLLINTSIDSHVDVFLFDAESTYCMRRNGDFKVAEGINGMIEELFKKNKKTAKDIQGIGVITGPGSFTAIRIGVTVANTLGFALHVPVLGFPLSAIGDTFDADKAMHYLHDNIASVTPETLAAPHYDKEPNITFKKP